MVSSGLGFRISSFMWSLARGPTPASHRNPSSEPLALGTSSCKIPPSTHLGIIRAN